jgi:hypothetical protein
VRERLGGAKRVVEHALHVQRRRNGARWQRRNHAQLAARGQGQGSRELLHHDVAGGAQERLAVGAQRLRRRHLHRVRVLGLGLGRRRRRRAGHRVAVLVQFGVVIGPAVRRLLVAAAAPLLLAGELGRFLAVPLTLTIPPNAHHALLLQALVVRELHLETEELVVQLQLLVVQDAAVRVPDLHQVALVPQRKHLVVLVVVRTVLPRHESEATHHHRRFCWC